ncbi:MAG: 3-oxoacyl-[acyl-carrier-protein] synthase III C-terminal domain-containing protein, partial [Alphaproteobacteria bacterium]
YQSLGHAGNALMVDGGRLTMNGRAVFTFSVTNVPAQVAELLQEAGLSTDDIDLFCFHQGSRYIVDSLARRMALPSEKVPLRMKDHGNTVSSSLPILFESFIHEPGLRRVLFSGFGVGLSVASCLMERRGVDAT